MKMGGFEVADSAIKRAWGIMLKTKIKKPLLFVFREKGRKRNAIHSLFCFVRFDAVFLDEKKKVVDVKENVAPFSLLVVPKHYCKYLIEAPSGWAKKNKVKVGQAITFALPKEKK